MGLTLQLVFAGMAVFWFWLAEPDPPSGHANVVVDSVFAAAAGLWLVDSVLKKIPFPPIMMRSSGR